MAARIAATRANLIRFKRTLAVSEEGHALLDEKRRILISEFTRVLETARQAEREAAAVLKEGYALAARAEIALGRRALARLAAGARSRVELEVSQERVVGVVLPVVASHAAEPSASFSPFEATLLVDELSARWRRLLTVLAGLAEKKAGLLRLGREIQKTTRKVNALEKIHLPFYRETIKEVGERLDEEGREAFSLLKLLKEAREKRGGRHGD